MGDHVELLLRLALDVSLPTLPSASSSRARRTREAMIYAGIDSAARIQEDVPVASG